MEVQQQAELEREMQDVDDEHDEAQAAIIAEINSRSKELRKDLVALAERQTSTVRDTRADGGDEPPALELRPSGACGTCAALLVD